MTVWVVLYGELGEGGNVIAVFADRPDEKRVLSLRKPVYDGGWEWQSEGYWTNDGVDFLSVREHEVL